MFKKLIAGFLAFVVITLICASGVSADSIKKSDFEIEYGSDAEKSICGYVIKSYNGNDTDVVIPKKINGHDIVGISGDAFAGNTIIKSVTVPEGVKFIEGTWYDVNISKYRKGAFEGCVNLEKVDLPSSLVYIGSDVFKNTKILISQKDMVRYVDNWLIDCTDAEITSAKIKEGTLGIAAEAFCVFDVDHDYCGKLRSVTLPESLKAIGTRAFAGCPIEKIVFPDNLVYIGKGAFSECSLKSVVLPDSLEYLGGWAFCYNPITEITIPEKITVIRELSFTMCRKLKKVTFKGNITEIEEKAFYFCESLESVDFPKSLKKIGDVAFDTCLNLKTVTGGESIEEIGVSAFGSLLNKDTAAPFILEQPAGLKYFGSKWIVGYDGKDPILNIPEGVKGIAGSALRNLTAKKVVIPSSVTYIGSCAFDGSDITEIMIPNTVTKTGINVFAECGKLERAVIEAGTDIIHGGMFGYCGSLKEIVIPDGVRSIENRSELYHELSTFQGCKSLLRVTIPKSLTEIPDKTFLKCDSITDIFYEGSEEDWKNFYIGDNNGSLSTANVHFNCELPSYAVLKNQ